MFKKSSWKNKYIFLKEQYITERDKRLALEISIGQVIDEKFKLQRRHDDLLLTVSNSREKKDA